MSLFRTPHSQLTAPDPAAFSDPLIQVYGADVWGWRGRFAIHTWVATKPRDASAYTLYQVIGWRLRRGQSVVSIAEGEPDRHWYGSPPKLLNDVRGDDVEAMIARVDRAAREYPFTREYIMWPGPNSNSFTAWIGLAVPELNLKLPFKALGKRWMEANYHSIKGTPSD